MLCRGIEVTVLMEAGASMPWHTCGRQREICRNYFFPSVMGVSGWNSSQKNWLQHFHPVSHLTCPPLYFFLNKSFSWTPELNILVKVGTSGHQGSISLCPPSTGTADMCCHAAIYEDAWDKTQPPFYLSKHFIYWCHPLSLLLSTSTGSNGYSPESTAARCAESSMNVLQMTHISTKPKVQLLK